MTDLISDYAAAKVASGDWTGHDESMFKRKRRKKMAKAKKRPSKASGNRASQAAGKLMALMKRGGTFWWLAGAKDHKQPLYLNVKRLVQSVAGSVLSQDETKGRRK